MTWSFSALIAAPGAPALVRRHLAERREQGGDRALLAERGDAHGFQRGSSAPQRSRRGFKGGEVGHLAELQRGRTLLFPIAREGYRRSLAAPSRRRAGRPKDALGRLAVSPWPSRRWPRSRRLGDREIGENLAVDLDPRHDKAGDKARVGQPVLAHRRVDALDPQRAEFALAVLAVAVGVLQRLVDRSLGGADGVLAAAEETLGGFRTFLCLAWAVTPRLTRAIFKSPGKSAVRQEVFFDVVAVGLEQEAVPRRLRICLVVRLIMPWRLPPGRRRLCRSR